MRLRASQPEHWPPGVSFHETIERIQAYRRAWGWDAAPFAEIDYQSSLFFEERGAFGELREHLARAAATYPPETPRLPHLHQLLAAYARHCRDLEAAWEHLEDLRAAAQAARPTRAGLEARILAELEAVALRINAGLQEGAIGPAQRARRLVEDEVLPRLAPGETDWLVGDYLLEELNLCFALEDFPRAESTLAWARGEPWYEALGPAYHVPLRTRLALTRLEFELAHPEAPRMAEAELRALLEEGTRTDEELLILTHLAAVALAEGRLEEARAALGEARDRLSQGERACGPDLPTRREVDTLVLETLLAKAAGGPEALGGLEALRGVYERMLARWRELPLQDGGLAILHTRDRLRLATIWVDVLLSRNEEGREQRALEELARIQALGTLARELGAGAPSYAAIVQSLVPAAGGLLVYAAGAERSFVFAVDRDGVTVHRLPSIFRLDRERRELQRELGRAVRSGGSTAALEDALARTAALVVPQGVHARLAPWKEVVVVGLESVGYLPFELLPDGEHGRLGLRLALSYLPSLPVGVWLAEQRPLASDAAPRIRVVAATDIGGRERTALPFEAEEEELLFGAAPFLEHRTRRGEDATRRALAAAPEEPPALALHVLAHGVGTGRAERPWGLALHGRSGATILTPALAEELAAPPLVVVTACSSWRGPLRRGDDGRHHLGGAFFLAGARTQLLSAVEVDYRASLKALREFYRAWGSEGASPAEAMLAARQRHRDSLFPFLIHVNGLGQGAWLPPRPAPRLSKRLGVGLLVGTLAAAAAGAWWLSGRGTPGA